MRIRQLRYKISLMCLGVILMQLLIFSNAFPNEDIRKKVSSWSGNIAQFPVHVGGFNRDTADPWKRQNYRIAEKKLEKNGYLYEVKARKDPCGLFEECIINKYYLTHKAIELMNHWYPDHEMRAGKGYGRVYFPVGRIDESIVVSVQPADLSADCDYIVDVRQYMYANIYTPKATLATYS